MIIFSVTIATSSVEVTTSSATPAMASNSTNQTATPTSIIASQAFGSITTSVTKVMTNSSSSHTSRSQAMQSSIVSDSVVSHSAYGTSAASSDTVSEAGNTTQPVATASQTSAVSHLSQSPSTAVASLHSTAPPLGASSKTSTNLTSSSAGIVDGSTTPQPTSMVMIYSSLYTSGMLRPSQQVSLTPSSSAPEASSSTVISAASSLLSPTPGLCSILRP